MKLINESIRVDVRNGIPRRMQWQDRTYRTRKILDFWIHQTRWWGREEKRVYFRLETDRGIIEVYHASESTRDHPSKEGSAGPGGPSAANASGRGNDQSRSNTPFPIEGDTHTREYRRTDAAYRPDVRITNRSRPPDRSRMRRTRWVLSRIVD